MNMITDPKIRMPAPAGSGILRFFSHASGEVRSSASRTDTTIGSTSALPTFRAVMARMTKIPIGAQPIR